MHHELFMKLPKDYTDGKDVIVKLERNIYGAKQAGRLWYLHLHEVLVSYGCVRGYVDPCYFLKKEGAHTLMVCVYVDDILATSGSEAMLSDFKKYLESSFKKLKVSQDPEKFLGIEVKTLQDGRVKLSQKTYVLKFTDAYVTKHKIRHIPLPVDWQHRVHEGSSNAHIESLQDKVGSIRFAADRTRYDIMFAASVLGRYAANPNEIHSDMVNQTLNYLKGSAHRFLIVGSNSVPIEMIAYSDASFDRNGNIGQSGYAIYLSDDSAAVVCKSFKNRGAPMSSTDAEVNAVVECIKHVIWLRELLRDLGFEQVKPTEIRVDNRNIEYLCEDVISDNRSKHMINKVRFLQACKKDGLVSYSHVDTKLNVADVLTKALERKRFEDLTKALMEGYGYLGS